MKKLAVASVLLVGLMFSKVCFASEVDSLVNSLVDKGILTSGEARKIIIETNEQAKEQLAEGKNSALPEWVQKIKFHGDFRMRYEWDKDKSQADQDRARLRMRLGLDAKVNDKLTVGIGIATGGTTDPRSRNVTLGNNSNTPGAAMGIVLDYAYAAYMLADGIKLTAGKFQNPLWQPNGMFWKGDITPDGGALNINKKIGDVDVFVNDLFFTIQNDSRTSAEPFLNALQSGANVNFSENTAWKIAAAYYFFDHIKDQTAKFTDSKAGSAPYTNSGNTFLNGYYKYNYSCYQASSELSTKEFLGGVFPYVSLFGDYVYNPDPTQGKGGYDTGVKFGDAKVADKGQWQGKLVYSKLGRDCWLDVLSDSDRYGGDTNSRAYEALVEYGLGKNTSLIVNFFHAESLTKGAAALGYGSEQVLQIDWNMKF